MVDYSKWNNLDSGDSDSDSDSEKTRQEQQVQKQTQQQQQQQKGQQGGDEALKTATDRRFLDQAESIRWVSTSAVDLHRKSAGPVTMKRTRVLNIIYSSSKQYYLYVAIVRTRDTDSCNCRQRVRC